MDKTPLSESGNTVFESPGVHHNGRENWGSPGLVLKTKGAFGHGERYYPSPANSAHARMYSAHATEFKRRTIYCGSGPVTHTVS